MHQRNAHDTQRDLDDYIARMESPERAEWQKLESVLEALQLRPGMRVADLGCGPGYFTIPIAEKVGPQGKVWAIDIEPRMLERTAEHARQAHLSNIETVLAEEDHPGLSNGGADLILMVNTYHHLKDRPVYLSKLRRALAPSGRVAVIDFVPKSKEVRGFGPPLERQLPRKTVTDEFRAAGFTFIRAHTFLAEQYFVEYRSNP